MVNKITRVKFRRRRDGVTNYKKRLGLVKSGIDRVVVRKSNRRITGQVVKYNTAGDSVIVSVDSNELKALGWPSRCNRSTSYLTGLLLAKKAKDKVGECILDIGLNSPVANSVSFVFAKGCIDGGMKVSATLDMKDSLYDFSSTAKYAAEIKKEPARFSRQFGAYVKEGKQPEAMPQLFKEVKEKILKG